MAPNFFGIRSVSARQRGLHGLAAVRYDTGVMGSVLALNAFKKGFGLPTDSSGSASSNNAKFFGTIVAAFLNEHYGRRYSLMFFSVIFLIGAALFRPQLTTKSACSMLVVLWLLGYWWHASHHSGLRLGKRTSSSAWSYCRTVPEVCRHQKYVRVLAQLWSGPPYPFVYGVGMGAVAQWLFNFVVTKITPEPVNHIGGEPSSCSETRGRTLEDMDVLFAAVMVEQCAEDVERSLAVEQKGASQLEERANRD
ncbi:hypothetical protein CC80DRAFT_554528 [Byssothecium circinans]|uniref:Major facilitator superfamily (MFS) profile domain-containing protein n=1 Tax=Byssothecium circinans TaxID=147558 RepID=A0A6A5TDF5_9PLEO|nr:hypothetical protein CC80DRAFT_554528 [Byssothecium circinans]